MYALSKSSFKYSFSIFLYQVSTSITAKSMKLQSSSLTLFFNLALTDLANCLLCVRKRTFSFQSFNLIKIRNLSSIRVVFPVPATPSSMNIAWSFPNNFLCSSLSEILVRKSPFSKKVSFISFSFIISSISNASQIHAS